ncbi:MAG TPA: hypothetical protein VH352_06150 [Pseudonocardiaceae bacterium]|jgi:hypothetical protein|nr:hypothetical protein [Pseudonocardiaceae bacterium]
MTTTPTATTPTAAERFDWLVLTALVVDAIVLALLEVFFLPVRFDGRLLPRWGSSTPFPITVVLALVTMPLLVSAAARVSARLLVAGGPLWAWLLTIGVVGFAGPENMVLLQDWRTLLLLACGTLPAAVALGNGLARRPVRHAPSSGSGDVGGSQDRRTG